MMFDFFYGDEPKQYAFYSIPQLLFTDEKFVNMSCEAKVLYGLLLDKAGLSVKNGWTDPDGKVFVYFKRQDVCEMLGCKKDKASKILAELDDEKGIGLIKRVSQGQGKPTKIYVRHFLRVIGDENAGNPAKSEYAVSDYDYGDIPSDVGLENKTDVKRAEKPPSRSRKNRPLESGKTDALPISHTKEVILSEPSYPIYRQEAQSKPLSENDRIDTIDTYRQIVKENIEYDWFAESEAYAHDMEQLDEIVELMVECICSNAETIRVGGQDCPQRIVKDRLLKLNEMHIEYVLECLNANTSDIRNIKSYLITTLYNAPITISSFFKAKVQHDMPYLAKKDKGDY